MQASNSHEINNAALTFIQHLLDSNYWGSISLRMESGRIVHLYKEESIKPESLSKPRNSKDEPYAHHRNVPE